MITIYREIKDPRREHLKEHGFECIFYIAVAAVIGGRKLVWCLRFRQVPWRFFRSRIPGFKSVPSHDTFNRVFSLLSSHELEKGFRRWISEICGNYSGLVAIDGKEICGAKTANGDGSFEHLRIVSVWASANGVCMGQDKAFNQFSDCFFSYFQLFLPHFPSRFHALIYNKGVFPPSLCRIYKKYAVKHIW